MFSNLRVNSQLYILHKDNMPIVETATVVSVSQPVPKFPITNYISSQEYVVDIVAKVKDTNITLQKLPANLDIADQGANGNMVITTSKEAMNAEVDALRQKSLAILNNVDYHKNIIQECEKILQELNPEFAEQKQQKQDIDNLKAQMSEIMQSMKDFMAQMKTKIKE